MKKVSLSIHYEFDNGIKYRKYRNGKPSGSGWYKADEEPDKKQIALKLAYDEIRAPRSGKCCFCGSELGAYQTKMQSFKKIACLGCQDEGNIWWMYSDG